MCRSSQTGLPRDWFGVVLLKACPTTIDRPVQGPVNGFITGQVPHSVIDFEKPLEAQLLVYGLTAPGPLYVACLYCLESRNLSYR